MLTGLHFKTSSKLSHFSGIGLEQGDVPPVTAARGYE